MISVANKSIRSLWLLGRKRYGLKKGKRLVNKARGVNKKWTPFFTKKLNSFFFELSFFSVLIPTLVGCVCFNRSIVYEERKARIAFVCICWCVWKCKHGKEEKLQKSNLACDERFEKKATLLIFSQLKISSQILFTCNIFKILLIKLIIYIINSNFIIFFKYNYLYN